ncbi:unnamed protein product [Prunus armeniaca]
MGIKRTSTLSSTSLTSQPLPTAVWIAGTSKKLAGFYPKSSSLVRVIPSTICFDPAHHMMRSSSHLLLFIAPVFGLPSPPPATPSDDMDIKRTSMLSSTTLTSQPLPTVVWITEKSKKLAGFYPKSPLLVRAIPSTIFFDPGMIFQPLELFLLLVVLVRRNF